MKKADDGVLDRFAIEVASGAAHGLLDLIGDILDIARIESGRLSLAPVRANLHELLVSVIRVFDGLARQKHLSLVSDIDSRANCDVMIDPLRFKQIVSNLLSNAIKFTSDGNVRISMRIETSADVQRLGVLLKVVDSGCGISQDDQQRLFTPFTQASNNNQSARNGSGLGLMISRTLCEMMSGDLKLSSTLGQGTEIEVRLDLPILEPTVEMSNTEYKPSVNSRTLDILVVDDYPANRQLLSQQLRYLGHRVKDAKDGAQGLRTWRNGIFDVVITDCNMPNMDGYELTQAIRNEESVRGLEPKLILGFTANAQPEEKARCLAAGMDDCLFKPISLKDLKTRLFSVVTDKSMSSFEDMLLPSVDEFDLFSLDQLTGGDEALINTLLKDLTSSNNEDMALLISLFTKNDLPGLNDLAHRIKGGARIIKATGIIQCCENLEAACRGSDPAQLTEAVDSLQRVMERLAERLEKAQ